MAGGGVPGGADAARATPHVGVRFYSRFFLASGASAEPKAQNTFTFLALLRGSGAGRVQSRY